jgi:hypothetical protein
MARDLKRPASTVHGWKKEGRIPAGEQPYVLAIAEQIGIPITAEHVVFLLVVLRRCSERRCCRRLRSPRQSATREGGA